MSNYDDVQYELGNLENVIDNLLTVEVCELVDNISDAQEHVRKVERELSYLEDDLQELSDFQDYGDVDDIEAMQNELESLKAKPSESAEIDRLTALHAAQANIITALLGVIREARRAAECNASLLSEDVVIRTMCNANTEAEKKAAAKTDG